MARETVSKMVFGPTGDIISDRIKEVRYIKSLEQQNAALEAERDRLGEENEQLKGRNHDWHCGCDHWNGANLATCSVCGRRPREGMGG